MVNQIPIYLFPDTIIYLKNSKDLVHNIQNDNNIKIKIINKKTNPYVLVSGKFENCHKTRILLHEIEKNNYHTAN